MLNNKMLKVQKSLNISNKELTNKNIEITNLGNKLNLALEKKVGELEEGRKVAKNEGVYLEELDITVEELSSEVHICLRLKGQLCILGSLKL